MLIEEKKQVLLCQNHEWKTNKTDKINKLHEEMKKNTHTHKSDDKFVSQMFNQIYDVEQVPSQWNNAITKPLL